MSTIVVAFPKIEEAKAMKGLLVRNGYNVAPPCISGAAAVNMAESLSDGIIICGYKLSDMLYTEVYEYKPKSFQMLLVASKNLWTDCEYNDIVCAALPIKVNDLLNTIRMMQQSMMQKRQKARTSPRQRTDEEKKIIESAKHLLMEKNNLTEPEAHRYIQKCSMDSGNSFVESAQMIISIYS